MNHVLAVELLEPDQARLQEILGFPLVDADISATANINATKLGTGVVDNTEFNFLNGVTSAIQTQIDTKEATANKGAVSGYAGLDGSQELLLTNFPSGSALQVLRRDAGNTALEFATIVSGVTSINSDSTAAQIIAGGTGIDVGDAGATHTISIDATVATLAGTQAFTNKTITSFTNTVFSDAQHMQARNASGISLSIGDVVFISGYNVGQDLPEITKANADSASTMPVIGIVNGSIANNANGEVCISGRMSGLDTSSFTAGDTIYASTTAGVLTNVKPTGANLIQNMGVVLRSHASMGVIEIVSLNRTNDLPNIVDGDMWIGNGSAVPTAVTMSGDITITNAGVTTIDPAYVGQTSITTLGTIGTGVWEGTAITGTNINAASTDLTDTAVIAYLNTANTWTTGLQSFAGVTLRIPSSATPSVTVNGDIAYDDTVTDFSTGLIKFFGTEEQGIVSMPIAEFTTPSDGFFVSYNGTNDEFELVAAAGTGDMVLADVQTVTGAKTFENTTLLLRNVADTFNGSFVNTNTADRVYTLQDEAGTIVMLATTDTLTNKTIGHADFTNHIHADVIHVQVRNESGVTISVGDAVFVSGYSVGQDLPLVMLADSSSSATMPAFGIVSTSSITNNNNGSVYISGRLANMDTSGFNAGDVIYVSNVGTTGNTLTATHPTGTDLVQVVGEVLRSHATLGVLEVEITSVDGLPNIAEHDLNMGGFDISNITELGGVAITAYALSTDKLDFFAATTSAELATVISDESGSGLLVFNTSPTLVSPALGTPTALVGTNITGTASAFTASNVTTNANLTGPITSVGNATTIISKAVTVAMLADGTDGELITWSATGVAAVVAVGTVNHVLTSGGVGVAPTFQAIPASIAAVVDDTSPQLGGFLDANGFNINLDAANLISFDGATEAQNILGGAGGIIHTVPDGDTHNFVVDATTVLSLAETTAIIVGTMSVSGLLTATGGLDAVGANIDNIQNLIHDISASGTDIDFNEDEMQTISIAANTTFTTANRAAGTSKTLKITTDSTLRTFTWPAWDWVSEIPADQAGSKNGYLTLTCYGATDALIVAAYQVGSL